MLPIRLVAGALLLGLCAAVVPAHAVDAVVPMGATYAGVVEPGGRETVVGVLIPAGTASGSITVKAARGSLLVPQVALAAPNGTVRTAQDFLAELAVVRTTPKSMAISKIATFTTSGLYRVIVTGVDDTLGNPTAGAFTVVVKGKPSKGFKTLPVTLTSAADKDNYILNVPENGTLTVSVKPQRLAPFVPSLQILTPSGDTVNYDEYVKYGLRDSSITVRNLPLAFFGDHTLRVGANGAPGDYILTATVKAKKRLPLVGAPVADAGGTVIVEQTKQSVLDGSGTVGGDTYQWCQVSGPPLSIVTRTSKSPAFVAPVNRVSCAWQMVSSNAIGRSLASVAILEVDRAPIASAGPSRSVAVGAPVTLDGSGSSDLDAGDVLSYEWTQVSGPAATLSDPWIAQPSFTPGASGTYVFRLVVNDGIASSAPDTVIVVAGGAAPAADAGRPIFVRLQDSVFLSGLRSVSASGGAPASWSWTADPSNPTAITLAGADTPVASFTAPKTSGRWRFRLAVDGGAAVDDVEVVVTTAIPENLSPVARAGSRQTVVQGAAIDLDGSGSSDDISVQSWEWGQVGGPDAGLESTGATSASGTAPNSDAVLRFWLMVHDGRKYGAPDQVTVVVGSQGAPVADAGTDREGFVAQVLTLSSSGSLPSPGQTIDGRQWVQVSGRDWYDVDQRDAGFDPLAESPAVVVPGDASSLTSTRVLLFALTVSDPTGTSIEDLVSVTFTGLPKNAQPVASAQINGGGTVFRPGNMIVMAASAVDADGDPVSWFWEQIAGPPVSFAPATLQQITVTAPVASATLTFRVTANDGTGEPNSTDTAEVSFSVNRPPVIVISSTPSAGPAGTFVTLSGNGTTDPDDGGLTYAWTELPPAKGGLVTLSGADTITATFTQPVYQVSGGGQGGTQTERRRTFRLTVTDGVGPSGAVNATVNFSPNVAPVLGAVTPTGDRKIFYSNSGQTIDRSETLTANGSGGAGPTVDADGDTLSWSWRIVSGPFANPPSSYLSSTTQRTVTFGAPRPTNSLDSTGGVYRLGVTGSDGAELSAEVTVDVLVTASFLGDVYPMFTATCNSIGCHNASSSGGLRLDQGASQSRTNLVTSTGYAQPNNYSGSTLYTDLQTGKMPKTGAPFAQWQYYIVRDWIQPEWNMTSPEGLSSGAENN